MPLKAVAITPLIVATILGLYNDTSIVNTNF